MSDIDYGEFNFGERDFDEQEFEEGREFEEGEVPQDDEPRMEATYGEMREKQVFEEQLDAHSQKDKPFIALRDALLRLEQEPKYIDNAIKEMRGVPSFPTLNAIYVANARLFLSTGNLVEPKTIKKWVTDRNKQFDKEYLNEVDFFRYLIIGQNIFSDI